MGSGLSRTKGNCPNFQSYHIGSSSECRGMASCRDPRDYRALPSHRYLPAEKVPNDDVSKVAWLKNLLPNVSLEVNTMRIC